MTGWSYVGAIQWLAALSGHPALRAINPIVGAGDIGDAMLHEGGAFQIGLVQPWVLGLAASDPRADEAVRQKAGALGAAWPETLRAPAHADPVADLVPHYAAWRQGRTATPASVAGRYDALDVPTFQIAGWFDIFCESALRHWVGLAGSPRPHRLVMGPWSHSNGLSNLHPEVDFGGTANGVYAGFQGAALDWMRRALDGEDVPGGMSCFVMHEGWRELTSWPPPAVEHVLHLSDGVLTAAPADGSGTVELRHDPADPVPTRGGRVLGPFLPPPGPVDQRPVEARDDVAVFTSQPLDRTVTVMGPVRAQVCVTSSSPALDVAVKLCDVDPSGRSFNVVDSVARVAGVPEQPALVQVAVGSTAYAFRPGHRIRVHVAGSNSPRFDVHPQHPAVHRLHWGKDSGSRVTLPVVEP
jgi:putative CocE/NonD family hydrolase